jgi:hypothetical protein
MRSIRDVRSSLSVLLVVAAGCGVASNEVGVSLGAPGATQFANAAVAPRSAPTRLTMGHTLTVTSRRLAALAAIQSAVEASGWRIAQLDAEHATLATEWLYIPRTGFNPNTVRQCADGSDLVALRLVVVARAHDKDRTALVLHGEVRASRTMSRDEVRLVAGEGWHAVTDAALAALRTADARPDSLVSLPARASGEASLSTSGDRSGCATLR